MTNIGRAAYPEIECWPAIHPQTKDPQTPAPVKDKRVEVVDIIGDNLKLQSQVFDSESSFLNDFILGSSPYEEQKNVRDAPLRIFFIDSIEDDYRRGSFEGTQNLYSWFTTTYGVSPLFSRLFYPSDESYRNDGGSSFPKKDPKGNLISLDGFYQIASGITLKPSYLWYRHSATERQGIASIYIIYQCPPFAKNQIVEILEKNPTSLLRPLSVDALILAGQLHHWSTSVHHDHSILRPIVSRIRARKQFTAETVYNLHYLSEHFHAVRAVFEDLKERTEHLLDVYRQYPILKQSRLAHDFGDVEHSLMYLLAQTRTQMRWVGTYIEHTQIVVDLLFNLDTAAIAEATQQDSSSMITMAAVTMFFLPGTFVSALFSMVFFNTDSSNTSLLVNSQLWLFFVITVPLTAAVFLTWELWRRWRLDSQRKPTRSDERAPSQQAEVERQSLEALPYGFEEGGAFRASPSPASSLRTGIARRSSRRPTLSR